MKYSLLLFYASLLCNILSFGSAYAMDQQQQKVPSLKYLAARSVARKVAWNCTEPSDEMFDGQLHNLTEQIPCAEENLGFIRTVWQEEKEELYKNKKEIAKWVLSHWSYACQLPEKVETKLDIHNIRVSPDENKIILSCSFNQPLGKHYWESRSAPCVYAFDRKQQQLRKLWESQHSKESRVRIAPNLQTFIVEIAESYTHGMHVYDVNKGQKLPIWKVENAKLCRNPTYDSTGDKIMARIEMPPYYNYIISCWQASSGKQLFSIDCGVSKPSCTPSVKFNADSTLFTLGIPSGRVWLCNGQTGAIIKELTYKNYRLYSPPPSFIPHTNHIASIVDNHTICIWNIDSNEQRTLHFPGKKLFISGPVFSPSGTIMVLTVEGNPWQLLLVDIATGEIIKSYPLDFIKTRGSHATNFFIEISPSGQWIVIYTAKKTKNCLLDLQQGTFTGPMNHAITFMPLNHNIFAMINEGNICYYDLNKLSELHEAVEHLPYVHFVLLNKICKLLKFRYNDPSQSTEIKANLPLLVNSNTAQSLDPYIQQILRKILEEKVGITPSTMQY